MSRAPALLAALALLAAPACKRAGTPSLAEVRQGLADRDARLTAVQLEGRVSEGDAPPVQLDFAYRAPNLMRGRLPPPVGRAFAFDGQVLTERVDAERRVVTYTLDGLTPPQRAGFLTSTFAPFLPEGFRAPLLPNAGVRVEAATHPLAREAVRLVADVPTGEGAPALRVEWVLRWPTLDFLAKRTGDGAELRVEEEHCEQRLRLCVPRRLTRWAGGQQLGETRLTRVVLASPLPQDAFRLPAPEGWQAERRSLVDAAAK